MIKTASKPRTRIVSKCCICKSPATHMIGIKALCAQEDCRELLIEGLVIKAKADTQKRIKREQKKAAADAKAEKKEKNADFRKRKQALNEKDPKWQKNRTKDVLHLLVKLLDKDLPCIVCNGHECGQKTEWDAGHYLTKSAHPELKFDPRNIFKQCSGTNTASTGRSSAEASIRQKFDQGIIARYGMEHLMWLRSYHPPRKYTCEELAAMRTEMAEECRRLKKGEPPSKNWRALPTTTQEGPQ